MRLSMNVDHQNSDASTIFRFGEPGSPRRHSLFPIHLEQISDHIEDTRFPCYCNTYSPDVWMPDRCRVCSGRRRKIQEVKEKSPTNPKELAPSSDYRNFHMWQARNKPHCDRIREKVMQLPIVENVMFKTILNLQSPDELDELVVHIILAENYDKDEEYSEKEYIQKTPQQLQYEEELRRQNFRLLMAEKELIQGQQQLHDRNKRLTMREIEICKREKQVLGELRRLCGAKELEAQQQNQISKRQQELETARLEILKYTQYLDEQHKKMITETENLKRFPEEQVKRLQSFKERHESLALIGRSATTISGTPGSPRQRRRAMAHEKVEKVSVDLLPIKDKKEEEIKKFSTPMIEDVPGFMNLNSETENSFKEDNLTVLDYPENDIFYYRENFMKEPRVYEQMEAAAKSFKLGRLLLRLEPWHFHSHVNMYIQMNEEDQVIVSMRNTLDENKIILGILRSKQGDEPFQIPEQDLRRKNSPMIDRSELTTKEIVAAFRRKFPIYKDSKISAITCSENTTKPVKRPLPLSTVPKFICEDLLELDRILKVRNYKFAVIYVTEGQKKSDEILANSNPPPLFYEFMSLLGDKIKMKGWKGYKADLDAKSNTTCTHSYYTEWNSLEIMFHVAPMINPASVARLVGNDVVAIIWLEDSLWNPACLVSQVLHAQMVVKPVQLQPGDPYKLRVGCVVKEGLPPARPKCTETLWSLDESLREFILTKCVNLERAAWHCPTTVRTQTRSMQAHLWSTREGQLGFIVDQHIMDAKEY